MPSTPDLRQPPVDPPDPVGINEAHFHRLSPDGEHLRLIQPTLKPF
jgi:hypothetical protein